MRAARFHDTGDIRVEDIDQQPLGPGDVRVTVEYCGICGSDLHEYKAGPIMIPTDPHPGTGEQLPLTMGHELSGVVAEAGEDAALDPGTPVVVNPGMACGECTYCAEGNYTLCDELINIGIHGGGGGFAENIVVPAENAIPVPEDFDMRHAALVEPLAVALHGVRRSGLAAGDTAAVFGAGPIGLGVVQALQAAGAREVFVSEPRDSRREVAADLGATTIDPSEERAVREIKTAVEGGADVTFEAAGVSPSLTDAVRASRKDGTVCVLSIFEEPAEFNPNLVMMAERDLVGSIAYDIGPLADRGEFPAVVRMLDDGRLDPSPLITSELPLSRVTEGFDRLADPESDEIKILVRPEE